MFVLIFSIRENIINNLFVYLFMGFFKRKDKVIDLSERYRKKQEQTEQLKKEEKEISSSKESSGGFFGIFGSSIPASTSNASKNETESYASIEDRKRKLAKRLAEMTTKLEDLSNQIYHLQQRIEVLERKSGVGSY